LGHHVEIIQLIAADAGILDAESIGSFQVGLLDTALGLGEIVFIAADIQVDTFKSHIGGYFAAIGSFNGQGILRYSEFDLAVQGFSPVVVSSKQFVEERGSSLEPRSSTIEKTPVF
jgi:hypothetical protein